VHYNQLPQMLGILVIGIGIGAGLVMGGRRPNGFRPAMNRIMKRMRIR
jgi:hypothetical protein